MATIRAISTNKTIVCLPTPPFPRNLASVFLLLAAQPLLGTTAALCSGSGRGKPLHARDRLVCSRDQGVGVGLRYLALCG